jgi:FkbM family methyltransferase
MRLLSADSVPDVLIVAFLASLFVISTLALLLLRHKNRLIWTELFRIREQFVNTNNTLVEIRKRIVITTESDRMRLPALMPSQYGEDILLWNFFEHKREGFFVEVGAYNGVGFSNTYFFEAVGWTGLLIEPAPEFYQACCSSRPHSQVINAAVGRSDQGKRIKFSVAEGSRGVGTLSFCGENSQQVERIHREGGVLHTVDVPLLSLSELLENHQGEIDFITIDVEGAEMDVLQGLDLERFCPRVLMIEDNSNGVDTSVKDWLALHNYGERFRCEHNVFYTGKEDKGMFRW